MLRLNPFFFSASTTACPSRSFRRFFFFLLGEDWLFSVCEISGGVVVSDEVLNGLLFQVMWLN